MSIAHSLTVKKRVELGKGHNRRLRAGGMVPGIFYSGSGENVPVLVPALPMEKLYAQTGRNTVFNLEIEEDGKKSVHPVMVWDVQYHHYKVAFNHIDFYGVDLEKEVKARVPLEFTGVAKGSKLGGKMETYREQLTLISKPLDMPKKVVIDVTNLDLNQTISVKDLELPANVRAAQNANDAIVSVLTGKADEGDEVI